MDIERYIPHRLPMRLIDRLVLSEPDKVVTEATISTDNAFYAAVQQGVPAWTGIEFMAQTAAVWLGLADERAGRSIEPAFLISARQYHAHQPVFALGQVLRVEVKVGLFEAQIVSFSGRIVDAGDPQWVLADAEFSAFRPDDPDAYLAASEPPGLESS
ncbi:hypothetical protein [Gilvimarinus xylanilyticus]|uniref:3-hydroxylacyl-ACP dehydratase n=1 Tax=Gilvimarinus xylanilyticus TaxID=2944139 RepID=A0A9X2I778_9GAMM|nr:hypothetical protein [Gilvimarinus xylanilyticus]MCP8900122.1 hypothetical protein [Gilvimarinus xylanilyticus]